MDDLTPEEVEKLRALLPLQPYVEEIRAEAAYRDARSKVVKRWRVIAGAFLVFSAALVSGWDNFKDFMVWLAR